MDSSWSDLPDSILDIIIHKLDFITFIRFSAVCRSWQNSWKTHRRICIDKSTKTFPWLIFKETPIFYSFSNRKTYNYPLQFPQFHKCFGSSNGFLLTTDHKSSRFYVINPSTGVYFQFPTCSVKNSQCDPWFHKAVMSVSPYNASSDPKQIVMVAILSSNDQSLKSHIRFLKFDGTSNVDDCAWTRLEVEQTESHVVDIIFHKGRLYATKVSHEMLFFHPNLMPVDEPKRISDIPLNTLSTDKRYFVESPNGDELFMVVKRINNAKSYFVFKYDESIDEWIEVESLGDIALFVGHNSFSIFPELCCESSVVAKDCIYHFDKTEKGDGHDVLLELNREEEFHNVLLELNREEECHNGINFVFRKKGREEIFGDVFEFNMGDGSVKQLNASVQMSSWALPIWFLPSL